MNTKVITPESIKSYKKWVPSSMDMVLGIFESDGSFQVRTYVGVTVLTFPSAMDDELFYKL